MLNKIIGPAAVAFVAALLLPSKVDAWGAARVSSTGVGPGGGVYHTERTVVGGPGGVVAGSRTTAVGAPGGAGYRYKYGYTGGVGVDGGGPGYGGDRDGLSGPYVTQGGAQCDVRRDGDGYIFTNDQGSWAASRTPAPSGWSRSMASGTATSPAR
jgi:hypothetical protein